MPLEPQVSLFRPARITLALAACFAALNAGFVGPSQDTYTLLHYAWLMLHVGGLYSQWILVNTPLAVMLYVPPAAVIGWLHWPAGFVLHVYMGVLCAFSLVAIHYGLKGRIDNGTRKFWLAGAAAVLLIIASLCSVFADREHLLFIFTLPWMIQMLLGIQPATFTTALAAIGFLLKPYNLIFFAALQVFGGPQNTWRGRIFTMSSAIMLGAYILYAAVLYLFFSGYAADAVPLALVTYGYLHKPLWEKLIISGALTLAAGMLVFQCIDSPYKRRIWYGLLAAGVAVYCLNAGWSYTLYLIFAPMTLLCFFLLQEAYAGHQHRMHSGMVRKLMPGILIALLAQGVFFLVEDIHYTRQDGYARNYMHLPPAFHERLVAAAGDRFILLSTTLWSTNISAFGKPPESVFAYDMLWMLPWAYARPHEAQSPYVRETLTQRLLEALARYPDATLLVDVSPLQWRLPAGADVLAFLKSDARVKEALASYRQVQVLNDCGDPKRERQIIDAACRFAVWRKAR